MLPILCYVFHYVFRFCAYFLQKFPFVSSLQLHLHNFYHISTLCEKNDVKESDQKIELIRENMELTDLLTLKAFQSSKSDGKAKIVVTIKPKSNPDNFFIFKNSVDARSAFTK